MMLSVYPTVGRDRNHELAGFWQRARSKDGSDEPSVPILEPSVGRDCGIGSIPWPRPPHRRGFAGATKALINVLFRGRVYVWQRAHVLPKRKMRAQMTSGSGFGKGVGTFGPSRMVPCLFERARACGPTAWPAPLAKAIGVTCCTAVAVGNGIRSTCRRIWWRTSSWPWKTGVVSRI